MKDLLKEIIIENRQRFNPKAIRRETQIDIHLPKVQVITGPRRAGKSSLLRLTIAQLLESGTGWDHICYLPLEDERLRGQSFPPDTILQAFRELSPDNSMLKDVFFFFDEIQYLAQWEPFINRIHEQISRHIVITGSNSRTLHTEVSSVLRGRGLAVELLPLSFSEYLSFKEISFSAFGDQAVRTRTAFHDFVMQGGYPETVGLPVPTGRHLLQEYFNTVMYRDIIDQERPANYSYLRYLFHRIAGNTGKTAALSKIFNELKSQGYAVSKNSIYDMVRMAEDVYLYKRISRYDASLIKRENSDKKGYFIDNGMLNAIDAGFSSNKGVLLENLIFWQLYRQYGNIYTADIYYYKDAHHECDFILFKEGGHPLPIQVCWQMDTEETRQRELKGLVKACDQTGSSFGIVITLEQEGELTYKDKRIIIIPAWKWCAERYNLYNL